MVNVWTLLVHAISSERSFRWPQNCMEGFESLCWPEMLSRIPNTQRFQWLSVRELLLRERILMVSECPHLQRFYFKSSVWYSGQGFIAHHQRKFSWETSELRSSNTTTSHHITSHIISHITSHITSYHVTSHVTTSHIASHISPHHITEVVIVLRGNLQCELVL